MRKTFTLLMTGLLILSGAAAAGAQSISDEARRHMIRGETAMEMAGSRADYEGAAREFERATELAPEWADAWYNLGVAREYAEDYAGAIESYKKYLALNPTAADRDDVETLIIRLEFKIEKAREDKVAEAKRQAAAEADLRRKWMRSLEGEWRDTTYDGTTYCNDETIYTLSVLAPDKIALKFNRFETRRGCTGGGTSSLRSIIIEAVVIGSVLEATKTVVNDYRPPSGFKACLRRGTGATEVDKGTGLISEDGRRIELKFPRGKFDVNSCSYTYGETYTLPLAKMR